MGCVTFSTKTDPIDYGCDEPGLNLFGCVSVFKP